jgi:DNA-binding PadR family transcriptional regulator
VLGNLEQLILLAILRAGNDAYGVTIAAEIEEHAGRSLNMATIYKTLERMEEKALVRSTMGDPTPVRGGKGKRYFQLTPSGRKELVSALEAVRRMTPGLDLGPEPA